MKSLCRLGRVSLSCSWIGAQAALLVISFLGPMGDGAVQAAPVTFRFEAEINKVSLSGSTGLIPPLSVGDTVHGKFTFLPLDIDPLPLIQGQTTNITSAYPLYLTLGNIDLSGSSFDIESRDNSPLIDADGSTTDAIFVSGFQWIPNSPLGNLGWRPGHLNLRFTGLANDLLYGADVPSDVSTWNAFQHRSFSLVLLDNANGEAMFFGSIVALSQVPEPTAYRLSMLLLAIFMVFQARRFCQT